jgi:2-dehydro-3-deoxygalactonokinase
MLLGGDWGTTNLRLFRFDAKGQVIAKRERPLGVMQVGPGDFEGVLTEVAGDWLEDGDPVLLSGMVGSRNGWVEAPYLPCPAGLDDVASALIRAPSQRPDIFIVPGLSYGPAATPTDVMRGEETESFGAIKPDRVRKLIVAPGTHSKWTLLDKARVTSFTTYMTGELYGLLRAHSIFSRMLEGDAPDPAAFQLGLEASVRDPDLLSALFSTRTHGLFGVVAAESLAAYISGLLIGSEVAAGLRRFDVKDVTVIADDVVAANYLQAFKFFGVTAVTVLDNRAAAARGLWRLAQIAFPKMRTV